MRLRDGLDHYDDCVCNECMRKWDAKEAALEDGRAL